jgi:hypothetical protein
MLLGGDSREVQKDDLSTGREYNRNSADESLCKYNGVCVEKMVEEEIFDSTY